MTSDVLKKYGLLSEIHTLGDYMVMRKTKVKAFCDSDRCCSREITVSIHREGKIIKYKKIKRFEQRVEKQVPRDAIECPQCGSALFYQRAPL